MSKKRLCKLCKQNEATVPDRDTPWRSTFMICSACHSKKLLGDMKYIMEIREARASVALDGETQSGAECSGCRYLYSNKLNRCPKCGDERVKE